MLALRRRTSSVGHAEELLERLEQRLLILADELLGCTPNEARPWGSPTFTAAWDTMPQLRRTLESGCVGEDEWA